MTKHLHRLNEGCFHFYRLKSNIIIAVAFKTSGNYPFQSIVTWSQEPMNNQILQVSSFFHGDALLGFYCSCIHLQACGSSCFPFCRQHTKSCFVNVEVRWLTMEEYSSSLSSETWVAMQFALCHYPSALSVESIPLAAIHANAVTLSPPCLTHDVALDRNLFLQFARSFFLSTVHF